MRATPRHRKAQLNIINFRRKTSCDSHLAARQRYRPPSTGTVHHRRRFRLILPWHADSPTSPWLGFPAEDTSLLIRPFTLLAFSSHCPENSLRVELLLHGLLQCRHLAHYIIINHPPEAGQNLFAPVAPPLEAGIGLLQMAYPTVSHHPALEEHYRHPVVHVSTSCSTEGLAEKPFPAASAVSFM